MFSEDDDDSDFDPTLKKNEAFEKKCKNIEMENVYETLKKLTNDFSLTFKMIKEHKDL